MGDGLVGGGGWPVGSWVIVVDIIGNGGTGGTGGTWLL